MRYGDGDKYMQLVKYRGGEEMVMSVLGEALLLF